MTYIHHGYVIEETTGFTCILLMGENHRLGKAEHPRFDHLQIGVVVVFLSSFSVQSEVLQFYGIGDEHKRKPN